MKKADALHENFSRKEELPLPSEKSFARVMSVAFCVLAGLAWWLHHPWWAYKVGVLLSLAVSFTVLARVRPLLLRPLNRGWMKFGLLLHFITNPIIMVLIYALAILPVAIIMKLLGKDPLRRKFDARLESYWIPKNPPGPAPETIRRQF